MKSILFAVLIILVFTNISNAQDKVDTSDFEFNPEFRNVQVDASTIVFVTKIGGAIDFDLFSSRNKENTWQSLGFRFGADEIWKSTVGGPEDGSPFTNINGLARLSIEGKIVRLDTYAGTALQFESGSGTGKVYLKAGGDLKLKLTPNLGFLINGALCKKSSYFGIGVFISYQ